MSRLHAPSDVTAAMSRVAPAKRAGDETGRRAIDSEDIRTPRRMIRLVYPDSSHASLRRMKKVLLGILVLLVLLVLGAITAVGWQVILGPDARKVTNRTFEPTDARRARGE